MNQDRITVHKEDIGEKESEVTRRKSSIKSEWKWSMEERLESREWMPASWSRISNP